jgi:hypothetical protein
MNLLRRLTRFELACAKDAFVTIFPGPDGVASMDIEGYVQDTLARIPLEPVLGIRAAIWIVALAPLFILRRFRTLHGIAPSDRELVLVALATSPYYAVRQLVLALKALAALLYAGSPIVRARILAPGIAVPFVSQARLVRTLPTAPMPHGARAAEPSSERDPEPVTVPVAEAEAAPDAMPETPKKKEKSHVALA